MRIRALQSMGLVLALLLSGCLGIKEPEPVIVDGSQSYLGQDLIIENGRLEIPANSELRLENATLRLSKNAQVVHDGLLDVRGTLILRNANLESLFRLTAYPGSTLIFEGVTVSSPATAPLIRIQTPDARITVSELRVRGIEVSGSATITKNTIEGLTQFPAVTWNVGAATFNDNEITTVGGGVLFQNAGGTARGNTIFAGATDLAIGMDIRGGTIRIQDNRIEGGNASLSLVSYRGTVTNNVLASPRTVGLYYQDANATVQDMVIEGGLVGMEMTKNPRGHFEQVSIRGADLGVRATGGKFTLLNTTISDTQVGMSTSGSTPTLTNVAIRNATAASMIADKSNLRIQNLELVNGGGGMTWTNSQGTIDGATGTTGTSFLHMAASSSPRLDAITLTGLGAGISLTQGSTANVSNVDVRGFNVAGVSVTGSRLIMTGVNRIMDGSGQAGLILASVTSGTRIQGTILSNIANPSAATVEEMAPAIAVTGNSKPTITGNSLLGNQVGVFTEISARPIINANCISGNSAWGVATDLGPSASATIDAKGNWWGNPGGATPPVDAAPAAGDKAGYGVDFSQHLPATNCASP